MALDWLSKYNWKKSFAAEPESSPFLEPGTKSMLDKVTNETYRQIIHSMEHQEPSRCPASRLTFDPKIRKSVFNRNEHITFINACKIINSGKSRLSFREKKLVEAYNSSLITIKEENQKFLKEAEKNWKRFFNKPLNFNTLLKARANDARQHQLQKVLKLPKFYKSIDSLSFSHTVSDIPVQIQLEKNLLEIGKVSKFNPPLPNEEFHLGVKALPKYKEVNFYSQLPVSQDKNIDLLLQTDNIEYVISMSALKKLMNFTETNQIFNIPVVVKEIDKKDANGQITKRNVVFIDKVLPKQYTNYLDLNENIHKYLIKTNFCHIEAFSYFNQDIPIEKVESDNANDASACEDTTKDKKGMKIKEKDPLEFMMKPEFQILNGPTNVQLMHNASYKLWTIGQVDESSTLLKKHSKNYSYKILVRNKIDACENIQGVYLQPLLVVPKLEYQLKFGGNVYTKSELINQWTALHFIPKALLCRVRCHFNTLEVIKTEKCNIQIINNELNVKHNHKPQLGFGVLYKICFGLSNCSPGNYLLRHEPKNGTFINLLQEVPENTPGCIDLHEAYVSHTKMNENYVKPWIPIDVNLQLPHFTKTQHKSGLLYPCIQKEHLKYAHKKFLAKREAKKQKKIAQQEKSDDNME